MRRSLADNSACALVLCIVSAADEGARGGVGAVGSRSVTGDIANRLRLVTRPALGQRIDGRPLMVASARVQPLLRRSTRTHVVVNLVEGELDVRVFAVGLVPSPFTAGGKP